MGELKLRPSRICAAVREVDVVVGGIWAFSEEEFMATEQTFRMIRG